MSALRRFLPLLLTLAILSSAALAGQTRSSTLDPTSTAFEGYIELLRLQAGIPGLSGVLIQDGAVVWEKGLGFADVDARIPARADTPYLIGDLTEVLSGVLVLQCAEQRRIVLDREITNYGGAVPQDRATVRQVLNHTSALTGGFRFEPERYAQLTDVVEFCSRQPFRKTLALEILDRLAMARSVPGRDFRAPTAVAQDMFDPSYFSHYRAVLATLALPYRVDRRGHATRMELPLDGVNAATGLVSTVRDLAEFDRALDAGLLLQPETLAAAWQPAVGSNGIPLPTGLGWFVQSYRGTPIVWHYGVIADAYSAMMVKIPARRVTLILLANSDGLAIPFQLDAGDVTRSPFASVLLRMLL